MKRAYAHEVLVCPRCDGPMRLIAMIENPATVRRILEHLGLPARPPGPPWRQQPLLPTGARPECDGVDPPRRCRLTLTARLQIVVTVVDRRRRNTDRRRTWYRLGMAARDKKPRTRRSAGLRLSRAAAAKIQAVEGIVLSAEMQEMFRAFDAQDLPAGERRRLIFQRYAKGVG